MRGVGAVFGPGYRSNVIRPADMVAEVRPQCRLQPDRRISRPILSAWSPLTFLVDRDDASARHASALMTRYGVENLIVPDSHALADALSIRTPDMVMVDVPADGTDAIDTILMLGERNFSGSVQLTSEPGTAAIQTIRHLGKRHTLQMPPVLDKPLDEAALRAVLESQTQLPARAPAFASVSTRRSRTAGSSSGTSRRSISPGNAWSARRVSRACSIRRRVFFRRRHFWTAPATRACSRSTRSRW